jgi:acyl-coenzyme A synthetase/AMP-(fatty) acid ligase
MPREGAALTVAALQEHVGERLAPFKVPTRIAIFDEPLPRNASGKILKRELRDDFTRSGAGLPPSTAP